MRRNMAPEWSDLKVLLALAHAGSVAGAARELQVDTSTASRRLAALEEAVGARLLVRGGREFAWTPEGRTLIAAAESIDAAVTQALRTVRAAKVDVAGTVRVSVPPGLVPVLVRGLLPGLRQTYPGLRLELAGGFDRANLARGEADIAVRMARPDEPGLVACHAFDCGWFAYAADTYLQRRGRPERYEDLARHDLVLYTEALQRVAPLKWMEAYGAAASDVLRVDNLEVASQTIAAGGGIAVLPGFLGDSVIGLQRVFAQRVATNPGWVVYHESARDASRVRATVDALVAFFREQAATFSGEPAAGQAAPLA
jgi:DNA-binding transcriptional LysR family regulator